MKLQYYTATSIDGFIADDDHSLDWLFQFKQTEHLNENYRQFFEKVGSACMGSTTYEWILKQENLQEHPEKWPYQIPVWVYSSRKLPKVEGANIRFANGDVSFFYSEMVDAANGKNIWLIGGGVLVEQFQERGLLDEIILCIAPVILGSGAPLLPSKIVEPPLSLTDIQNHDDGFVMLTYEVKKRLEFE